MLRLPDRNVSLMKQKCNPKKRSMNVILIGHWNSRVDVNLL